MDGATERHALLQELQNATGEICESTHQENLEMANEVQQNTLGWSFEEKVSPASSLNQGDLIAFESDDRLKRYGIVVTADCDLTQKKHARLVTLVPVVEIIDVIECYLLLESCERNRDQLMAFVSRTLNIQADFELPEEVESLRVKVKEKPDDPAYAAAQLSVEILLHEMDRISVDDFKSLMGQVGVKLGEIDQKFSQQVQSKGDILVLPSLSSLGISADIAWVRHIWQVPLRNIVFRNSQLTGCNGQRIARLESPFRYRLTQRMAQVFSDIGLPSHGRDIATEMRLVLR